MKKWVLVGAIAAVFNAEPAWAQTSKTNRTSRGQHPYCWSAPTRAPR